MAKKKAPARSARTTPAETLTLEATPPVEQQPPAPGTGQDAIEDVDPDDVPLNMDYSFFSTVTLGIDPKKYFARPVASKEELDKLREAMRKDAEKVKRLLTKLETFFKHKVDQIGINRRDFEITIPIEYMSMKFTTMLSLHPSWVFIKCKVFNLDEVPEATRIELIKRVLVANFELNAVFYSIDPEEHAIWVENDIAVPGLNLEAFDIKFNAIIFGIKYFVDHIALPLDQKVKSTYTFKASTMYT